MPEPTRRADDPLLTTGRAWLDEDPDPATAAELADLLARVREGDDEARTDLADRFDGTLQFGTAGLRGALGAGPNRMNRAVVIRAAAGLAAYVLARGPSTGLDRPRVVIGYDMRRNSDAFALDTAAVMTGAGIEALVLPAALPTPVLAFAVRHLRADAGVMVTASHNPPQDNGYKVYLGGPGEEGAQIVPPADADIAVHIAAIGALADVERPASGWRTLNDDVVEAYRAAAASVVPAGRRNLRLVVTPLHGVGGESVVDVLRRAGFDDAYVVPEQAAPDGTFPTVAFPNPEEPGAVDLALAAARARDADLVIANDPDADRCAVAVHDPDGPSATGGWRMLRGDEVGALLGERLAAQHLTAQHLTKGQDQARATLACSIVSSRLLAAIAEHHGLGFAWTLTGFKWIARVPGLLFGYEEALGYCVDPGSVRDKDGISAAVVVADLANALKADGRTLLDALDDLARTHGLHATDQLSVRVQDLSLIAASMQRLRDRPPTELAGSAVVEATDLSAGGDSLPPTDGLLYLTAAGDRVVVRPSGTEPKLKAYLEVVVPVDAADVAPARAVAMTRLAHLRADVAAALAL